MQEEETIQQLIQRADEFYKKPDEFINLLEELLENVPNNEKGDTFFYVGRTLFHFSYLNLA
ncbi:MAG: hypothetical protein WA323_27260, partial [Candidatus Nitrosopolaris sp.]